MKKEPVIKILVACHKADPNIRQDEMYMPVHVGRALKLPPPELAEFQGDNEGDGISEKNGSYCELTALYWAWKNLKNVDYIGLCHYRRYFDLSEEQINKILGSGKVVIPREHICPHSNLTNLAGLLTLEEAYITIDTVIDLFPDMKDTVIDYFYNSNRYSVFNMFIMPWLLFEEYCEFIFTVLHALELKLKPNHYSRHRRNFGYIAESLFGLWIKYKNVKTHRTGIVNSSTRNTSFIKKMVLSIMSEISYRAVHPFSTKTVRIYSPAVAVGLKNDGIEIKHLNL